MCEMRSLNAVTLVFSNNVTVCFIRKHKETRKLNEILFTYSTQRDGCDCLHTTQHYTFRELQ